MNTQLYSTKYIFYFRGEDSVKNAINKISSYLWALNKEGEDKLDIDYLLNLDNPKLKVTYYKKELKLFDQTTNFVTNLHLVEEELQKTFTAIRIGDLASELEVSKNKRDLEDVTLRKGIPRTTVYLSIDSIPSKLAISAGGVTLAVEAPIKSKIKRVRKVIIPPIKEDTNILKGISNLAIDLLPKEDLPVITLKKDSKSIKTIRKPRTKKSNTPLSVEVKINSPHLPLRKALWSSFTKIGNLGKGVNTGMSNFVEKIGETGSDKSRRNIRKLFSNIFTPLNNISSEIFNLFHIIPNFSSNVLGFLLIVFYIIMYVIIIGITLIYSLLNIKGLPFLLDYLHSINFDLNYIPNLLNITIDWSIFDNISKIIKSLESDAPISEIVPEIIKQTESLIGNSLPESFKEAITNSFVSISEAEGRTSSQANSLKSSDVTTSLDEEIQINEDKPKDKDESSIFMSLLYTIVYGTVGLVAIDMISRIPHDPEFYSSLGDFASGIVSIGILSVTSLLQMIFGTNDNNNNNNSGSNSNKPDSFFNKWRSDSNDTLAIESKKDGQQSKLLRFKEGIASALRGDEIREDKLNKNGKICIEYKTEPEPLKYLQITENIKSALRGDEPNTTNKKVKFSVNDSRADDILGLSNYLPSFPLNGSSSSSNNNTILGGVSNTATNLYNDVSNTGRNIVNGVTNTGENLVNVAQEKGKNVIYGASNITKNIATAVADPFIPTTSYTPKTSYKEAQGSTLFSNPFSSNDNFISNDSVKEAVKTHISPWGAEYKDPQRSELRDRMKEDNSTSVLNSAKKLFLRRGDENLSTNPTGPLRTNLTDSMIPIVDMHKSGDGTIEQNSNVPILALNDEPMQLGSHLDPIYETLVLSDNTQSNNPRDSQNGVIYIYNNIITQPVQEQEVITAKVPLDRTIENQSHFMDGLSPKEAMDIIHSYGEQILDLTNAINMKEDLLLFQEKELKSQHDFQRSQENTIYGQDKVIVEQSRELDSQHDTLNIQREAIEKQALALQKARAALKTLTNSINFNNENSLLTRGDVDQMVNGISNEVVSKEIIPNRFEALRNNAINTNYGDHNITYTKELGQDILAEYNNNNANRMLTQDKIPVSSREGIHPMDVPERGTLIGKDNFMPHPPIRSTSLGADYIMSHEENDNNVNQALTRSQTMKETSSRIPLPTRSFSLGEITPNDSISSVNEVQNSRRLPTIREDNTAEIPQTLKRSNTEPAIHKEFWDPQPENAIVKVKGRWKFT